MTPHPGWLASATASPGQSPGALDEQRRAYSASPDDLRPGNHITILRDGLETFPAMLAAIERARRFIHLETYIIESDAIGKRFAEALIRKSREGVTVRVMWDAFGSWFLAPSFARSLREAGIDVIEYRPLRFWRRRTRWSRRDHRKILVADGEVGFLGGINLSMDYAPLDEGGNGWRDTHALVRGPVVADLERLFRFTWLGESGPHYPFDPGVALEAVVTRDTDWAAVIANGDRERRGAIRRHYLQAIRRATRSIDVASAYFVPDPSLRRALERAAGRGVRVRLILPRDSDVRTVQYASEHLYGRLLRAGVEIHLWPKTHMHAKTAVIDGCWSTIGSYNLDNMSLLLNLELMLEVVSTDFGQRMERMFRDDLESCQRLAPETWRQRSWPLRLASRLAYRGRRWL